MDNILKLSEKRKDGRVIKIIDGELVEFFDVDLMNHDHRGFYAEEKTESGNIVSPDTKIITLKPRET